MANRKAATPLFLVVLVSVAATSASAQSFSVQCSSSTITHPAALHDNNLDPAYNGPTTLALNAAPNAMYLAPSANVNGAIKCQHISGGDGFATMGDGTQTYMFSFGPLSGLRDIALGLPGTGFPTAFNTVYAGAMPLQPGDPATTGPGFTFNERRRRAGSRHRCRKHHRWTRGSPANDGCRGDERQHPRTADGDR